jgi:hypothetical protein
MIVGYEKPQGGPGDHEIGVQTPHPLGRAGRPDACVHEDALALGFYHEAVAARASAEDEHLHEVGIVAEPEGLVEGKAAWIGAWPPASFYDDALAMNPSTCPQCGHPAPAGARFCAQCGAVMGPAPIPKPVAAPLSKMTMMGFGAAAIPPPPAEAPPQPLPPTPAVAAPSATSGPSFRGTMLGLSSGNPLAPPPNAPAPAPPAPRRRAPQATVLGVALPGIAPLRAGDSGAPPDGGQEPAGPSYLDDAVQAPVASPVVPPPAPLEDVPAPTPSRFVRRKGVPIVAVALVAGGLLLGGGLGLFWLSRDRPAITAQLRGSPEGADVLGLHCDPESCKNGTTVDVDGARSTFTDGKSDLTLSAPLRIGDNPLALHVDRPGLGRDEVVRLVIPVSFRIRADLAGLSAPKPSVSIRVEAAPDSIVTLDNKALPLSADGTAVYSLDESAEAEGPADESRVVALQIPYSIAAKGAPPETGTVSARFSVAPLRIDVPGTHGIVDRDQILLAGRAARGATVTVDGATVATAQDGSFETPVALATIGEHTLQVRAGTPILTARTVSVQVKRVTSLAQEARAFERLKPLSYDVAMADPKASVGQLVAVEGEVMKARASGHRSILIVDDRRGCAKGSCLARVALAQDVAPSPGTVVRAYGRVAPPSAAPSGETVLEVEADFIVPNKR